MLCVASMIAKPMLSTVSLCRTGQQKLLGANLGEMGVALMGVALERRTEGVKATALIDRTGPTQHRRMGRTDWLAET